MVEMTLRYEGDLHTVAKHEPSSAVLETDAPVDNRGKGASFSPTDLLATSLASCMLTTMAIVADGEGWSLAGARARVEKRMESAPQRRVGRLVVDLDLPEALTHEARTRLEQVARGCPVARSIHPDLQVDLTLRFGVGA